MVIKLSKLARFSWAEFNATLHNQSFWCGMKSCRLGQVEKNPDCINIQIELGWMMSIRLQKALVCPERMARLRVKTEEIS